MVGLGPGSPFDRTPRAETAIKQSQVVVGYSPYVESIADLLEPSQETIATGMTREMERCRAALEHAAAGKTVSLVSSGDPGIYGMAGLAIEMAAAEKIDVPIEIIPGITAASAAAAELGAPLMLDFAAISLSDLLVPWEMIRQRLEAVAAADLVAVLYNPRSKRRIRQLDEAVEIFLRHREDETPVGIVTSASGDAQNVVLTDLGHLLEQDINMRSTVIIGNSTAKVLDGRFVTSRGYRV